MLRTAPKGAFTLPVTSFRNTSKLDTFFSLTTMRRPGKKGSPLRYTRTLFTIGCESHDPFAPGLVMLGGFGTSAAAQATPTRRLRLFTQERVSRLSTPPTSALTAPCRG